MNFFQELFTAGYNLRSKIARAEKIHTPLRLKNKKKKKIYKLTSTLILFV